MKNRISPQNKRIIGWMMFDWATQPFYILLLTFIFAPYFAEVAKDRFLSEGMNLEVARAQAQALWSLGQSVPGLLIAITAPFLGALADQSGRKLPWVWAFSVIYVMATAMLWCLTPDGAWLLWALIAFGIALIAAEFALIFTDAMLPSLGDHDKIGSLSGTGSALGYAGGVIALLLMLLFFTDYQDGRTFLGHKPIFGLDPEEGQDKRVAGPFAAIWFAAFMVPFFLWVRDANKKPRASGPPPLSSLLQTLKGLRYRKSLAAYLASSMFYRDALNGLYGFGGVYAALVLEWQINTIGVFGIVSAFSAAVFTYIGGIFDKRFGPRPVITFSVLLLIVVCLVLIGTTRESFWGVPLPDGSTLPDIVMFLVGSAIGGAGGALQAASRTMMVRQADPDRPTEAFGLYALSGKATAFLAPSLIGIVTQITQNARFGLMPVVALFVLGLVLLRWVEPNGEKKTHAL